MAAILVLALWLALWLGPAAAGASPLLSGHPTGLQFAGPTEASLTSIFWNPAAVGLARGHHALLSSDLGIALGKVERTAIDRMSGEPGGAADLRFSPADLDGLTPGFFAGLASDFGTERATLGVAVYAPFTSRLDAAAGREVLGPGDQGPLRYHLISQSWYELFVTPSISYQIDRTFLVGVGVSYVHSMVQLSFARDTTLDYGSVGLRGGCGSSPAPCGAENDQAVDAISFSGTASSVSVNAGVLWRPTARLRLGAAYISRPLAVGRSNTAARGEATVRRQSGQPPEIDVPNGSAQLTYALPDIVHVGASYQVTPRLLVDGLFRWVNYHRQQDLDVRLSGYDLRQAGIPERVARYRGFRDTFALRAGARYRLVDRLTLGGSLLFETSAVPEEAVNAAAVDAPKLELQALAQARVTRWLSLLVGYAVELLLPVQVDNSVFSPQDAVDCVDSGHDVYACEGWRQGRGRSTAAGHYRRITHSVGLTIAFDW